MAQSPNAVREPSMDELLASIREIIEESAGASASPHVGGQIVDDDGDVQLVNGAVGKDQAHHDVELNGVIAGVGAKSTASPQVPTLRGSTMSLDSGDSLSRKHEDVPVQAAMDALAERIGLRRQEEVTKSEKPADASGVSVLNPSFPYVPKAAVPSGGAPNGSAPNGSANVSPFPVEKVNAPPTAAPPIVPSSQVEKLQTGTVQTQQVDQQQQTLSQPQMQVPFQVHVRPPYPPNNPLQVQPPQSEAAMQTVQPSSSLAQGQKPVRVKLAPPPVPTAKLAPAAPSVQQVPSASPSQQQVAPKLQQQPFPFQPLQHKPSAKVRTETPRVADVKGKWDELEQDFRAEFEKSAELLLRPYIAQWLDEHFHHLFEKILREEIQRLVQNLRR